MLVGRIHGLDRNQDGVTHIVEEYGGAMCAYSVYMVSTLKLQLS